MAFLFSSDMGVVVVGAGVVVAGTVDGEIPGALAGCGAAVVFSGVVDKIRFRIFKFVKM